MDGERVRIPRGLARQLCKTAPAKIIQHARNPDRSVEIGGNTLVLAPVYGPPFVRDASGGASGVGTVGASGKAVNRGGGSLYVGGNGR